MAVPDIRREFVSLLPRLRRFALVLTGSVDQADDLVQGTLLRALDRIDQCRDSGQHPEDGLVEHAAHGGAQAHRAPGRL